MQNNQQSIRAIDKQSILQICSSQVVIDLKSAVKELVEKAIALREEKVGHKIADWDKNWDM